MSLVSLGEQLRRDRAARAAGDAVCGPSRVPGKGSTQEGQPRDTGLSLSSVSSGDSGSALLIEGWAGV